MKLAPTGFALVCLLAASTGSARSQRRHFEPEDLELEDTGTLDIDLQAGAVHGQSGAGNRLLLPDFELDLGILPNVELDLDGAFGFDHFSGNARHFTGESLWVSSKLGLYDQRDTNGNTWAFGLQLGPRFPTLDAAGVGYGGLALLGYSRGGLHWVLNAGGLIDPGPTLAAEHSRSGLLGLDLNADLDSTGVWSLQGELGAAYYFSPDPHELTLSLGATYAATPALDLSITALVGFLAGTDRAGLLLGASPKAKLW